MFETNARISLENANFLAAYEAGVLLTHAVIHTREEASDKIADALFSYSEPKIGGFIKVDHKNVESGDDWSWEKIVRFDDGTPITKPLWFAWNHAEKVMIEPELDDFKAAA